ncbi:MAG: hypothetical protein LH660_13375 [Phormidesmis sp. CAN_BIN36]|nr:hypothetical protein [Phormidesmis sp. CAN_BIN36]
MAFWIKLTFDRTLYIIDLDRIAAFCQTSPGRVAFSLSDEKTTILVNQQKDPDTYQTILNYIEQTTGHRLEE